MGPENRPSPEEIGIKKNELISDVERTQIYDNPEDDPVIQSLEQERDKNVAIKANDISSRPGFKENNQKLWNRLRIHEDISMYRRLIREYPDKAAGYRSKISEIDRIMARDEEDRQRLAEHQQNISPDRTANVENPSPDSLSSDEAAPLEEKDRQVPNEPNIAEQQDSSQKIESAELAQEMETKEDEHQVIIQAAKELGLGDEALQKLEIDKDKAVEKQRKIYENAMQIADDLIATALQTGRGERVLVKPEADTRKAEFQDVHASDIESALNYRLYQYDENGQKRENIAGLTAQKATLKSDLTKDIVIVEFKRS